MIIILLWLFCAFLAAALLSRFNRAGTGCLLGLLLGPIGLVISWVIRDSKMS